MKTNNPKNYRDMSLPHENRDKANEALQSFFDAVQEAREKYKIADILLVVKDSIQYDDAEGDFITHAYFGSFSNALSLAAYGYGVIKAEDNEKINKLLAAKK